MIEAWSIDGKNGMVVFPKGEVVYQTKGVVVEPLYKTNDDKFYISLNGSLQEVLYNPFNGYCYRQDGE